MLDHQRVHPGWLQPMTAGNFPVVTQLGLDELCSGGPWSSNCWSVLGYLQPWCAMSEHPWTDEPFVELDMDGYGCTVFSVEFVSAAIDSVELRDLGLDLDLRMWSYVCVYVYDPPCRFRYWRYQHFGPSLLRSWLLLFNQWASQNEAFLFEYLTDVQMLSIWFGVQLCGPGPSTCILISGRPTEAVEANPFIQILTATVSTPWRCWDPTGLRLFGGSIVGWGQDLGKGTWNASCLSGPVLRGFLVLACPKNHLLVSHLAGEIIKPWNELTTKAVQHRRDFIKYFMSICYFIISTAIVSLGII